MSMISPCAEIQRISQKDRKSLKKELIQYSIMRIQKEPNCSTMSEKFCLKWNDFHSNVSSSFSLLRNEDYLHDVTIVTDDNEQIAAHKLVLSACSEFFKNIFKRIKHSNPLLCLEGVSSNDLSNVMDYIYNGEVQIFQEDLDRFLNVAQRLKLHGLLTDSVEVPEEEKTAGNEPTRKKEAYIEEDDTKINSYASERHEKVILKLTTDINPEKNIKEIDEKIEQNIVRNMDGTYSCITC